LRFSTPEHVRGRANSHPRDCAEVDRVCLAASPSVDASDDAVDEAERSPACQPEWLPAKCEDLLDARARDVGRPCGG
jgi:hypothetical protein